MTDRAPAGPPGYDLGRAVAAHQWAVKGAAGLGSGVAQDVAADQPVVGVPAQLAARARLLNTRYARKTAAHEADLRVDTDLPPSTAAPTRP
jgi:hypothetical protein